MNQKGEFRECVTKTIRQNQQNNIVNEMLSQDGY